MIEHQPPGRVGKVAVALLLAFCSAAATPGQQSPRQEEPTISTQPTEAHAEWGYDGGNGPERWAELGAKYRVCADGREESPIDLRNPVRADFGPLHPSYRPTPATIVNNGHTVQLDLPAGQMLDVHDRRYELVQLHIHHPSEHLLEGRRFPLEFHLVHRGPDGALGVIGILGEIAGTNAALEPLFASLPGAVGEKRSLDRPFDPRSLLPRSLRYLTYEGSLTTPPCTENVDWFVLAQSIKVGAAQVERFARLYRANARPVQRRFRRFVLSSR